MHVGQIGLDTEFDIIVVGAGGSGLAAAVSAAQNGARVLVLEKQARSGGATGIAVGSFTAAGTSLQASADINDSVTDHAIDAGRFAPQEIEAHNNHELREFFLEHAAETLQWLMGMGLTFHGPGPEPPNRVPRMHNVVPRAEAYIATLCSQLTRFGGTLRENAAVQSLIQDADQRVIGVRVHYNGTLHEVSAVRGVVLAAGDYASAPDLIARFKGTEYSHVQGINPHARGDGHRMVEAAGGSLTNMEITYGPELRFVVSKRGSLLTRLPAGSLMNRLSRWLLPLVPDGLVRAMTKRLLVTWQHPEDSLFDDGAILVNREGLRFCDERQTPERELKVAAQPAGDAFLLLNEQLIRKYSAWPCFVSTAPRIAYAYVHDYLRLRPDVTVKGSLRRVASVHGIPASALERSAADAFPEQSEDWVLMGPVRSWFTTTEGGAAISQRFEVLDENGEAIRGLYAVGQTGLGGQILWGHGLHIAWAMTSGRLAGRHLASAAAESK